MGGGAVNDIVWVSFISASEITTPATTIDESDAEFFRLDCYLFSSFDADLAGGDARNLRLPVRNLLASAVAIGNDDLPAFAYGNTFRSNAPAAFAMLLVINDAETGPGP